MAVSSVAKAIPDHVATRVSNNTTQRSLQHISCCTFHLLDRKGSQSVAVFVPESVFVFVPKSAFVFVFKSILVFVLAVFFVFVYSAVFVPVCVPVTKFVAAPASARRGEPPASLCGSGR
jgi:hypothetical protein